MKFMHNNRTTFNCFTYFVAVNYTACTHSPSSGKIFRCQRCEIAEIFHEILHEIFHAKKFHEILHH